MACPVPVSSLQTISGYPSQAGVWDSHQFFCSLTLKTDPVSGPCFHPLMVKGIGAILRFMFPSCPHTFSMLIFLCGQNIRFQSVVQENLKKIALNG